MKKLMSLVLCAFVLSIASASIGCGETAKKADTGKENKREGGGPVDKGGTPTK